ncbi:hypothetical protein GUJ93_ZPchr0006g43759 [Zizania palustris]|uniref:Uncharacterized protein n=1 Tax=Zizania palustris TaxID=103762 RepID=A0A8J5SPA1_ZIZPA|nr:hypothetical protein GUJ93_ZPchr0006g43759 [Zizania palustris]
MFFSTNKARAQLAALGLFSRGGPASPRLPHRSAACSIPPPAWEPGCPSPAWEANDQDTGAQETDDQEPLHAMLSSPPAVGAQDSKLGKRGTVLKRG